MVGVESGSGTKYACMWVGCKVYGKQSSSLKWLESHVPRHGGKFAYPCIVEGCRMRFSSQVRISLNFQQHKNIFQTTKNISIYFVLYNSLYWTHQRQLEIAKHKDTILKYLYLAFQYNKACSP